MTNLILLFMIYGVLGWFVEVIYVGILSGKFYNRGFLYMPFLPIYAFGALFLTLTLQPNYGPLIVYVLAVFYTSCLEYATSVIMERLFHTRWWDYSAIKYNLNGRICLRNSLLFGILGLVVIYGLNPVFEQLITSLSTEAKRLIANGFLIILIIDLYFTLHKVSNLPLRDIRIISGKVKAYQRGKLKELDQLIDELDDFDIKHELSNFTRNISNQIKHPKLMLSLVFTIIIVIGLVTNSLVIIQLIALSIIILVFIGLYNYRHK